MFQPHDYENRENIRNLVKNVGLSSCIKRVKHPKYGLTFKALLERFTSLSSSRPDIAINDNIL